MDDLDTKLADARAQLVSKLYGFMENLELRAMQLEGATLERAADLLPLMVGPVGDIEVAVRKLDNLLHESGDPHGGATHYLRKRPP